jgi:hypothetical protein
MVTRLLAVLALIAVAGMVGVMWGRATAPASVGSSTYRDGYRAGVTAEHKADEARAKRAVARYQPGQPAYNDIYAAGRREGRRLGERLGREAGKSAGRRVGFKAGQSTALPDFAGGWRASHWYMVKLEPTSSGKSVRIGKRVIVSRGRLYGPCQANADDICAVPQN